MKKLIPTLLPLIGLAITAVSPQVQASISHFVALHTGYAGLISTIFLIVNHWLPSPTELPSNSSVARAGTAVMLCFALIVLPMMTTGCTYNQAQVTSAVQKVEIALKDIQSQIPVATVLVSDLSSLDPPAALIALPVLGIANIGLTKAVAACDAYVKNPGATAYQALLNIVDDLVAQIDLQALAAAKITNPQSQTKAVASIGFFTTGIHLALGILQQFASSSQISAVPAQTARVSFEQIRPFLKRDEAKQELTKLGFSHVDQILSAQGL